MNVFERSYSFSKVLISSPAITILLLKSFNRFSLGEQIFDNCLNSELRVSKSLSYEETNKLSKLFLKLLLG